MALRAALPVLLATLALAACMACGGGGEKGEPLTLEQFFQRWDALDQQFETQSTALDPQFQALNDQNGVEAAPGLLSELTDAVEEYVDGLDGLHAPEEALGVQDEAVRTGREVVTLYRDRLDRADRVQTFDELIALFSDAELNDAFAAFDESCAAAVTFAAEHSIDIDLTCA